MHWTSSHDFRKNCSGTYWWVKMEILQSSNKKWSTEPCAYSLIVNWHCIRHVHVIPDFVIGSCFDFSETEYDDQITCKHSYSTHCHVTYKTAYEPQQEEECEDNYRKRCFIEFKQSASDETVQFCHTPLVRNCDIPGPEVCSTEYRSECTTRYYLAIIHN